MNPGEGRKGGMGTERGQEWHARVRLMTIEVKWKTAES